MATFLNSLRENYVSYCLPELQKITVSGFVCEVSVLGPQGNIPCIIYHDTQVSSSIQFQPVIQGNHTITYTVTGMNVSKTMFINV